MKEIVCHTIRADQAELDNSGLAITLNDYATEKLNERLRKDEYYQSGRVKILNIESRHTTCYRAVEGFIDVVYLNAWCECDFE